MSPDHEDRGADGSGPDSDRQLAPAVASARGDLVGGLPAAYLESDFTIRFVGSLEEQLDPIVATLDSLASLVSPATAPEHMLRLEAAWLGLVLDEDLPVAVCRALVRNAPELGALRGTAAGLELLLKLTFPGLTLSVFDGGRVSTGTVPPPAAAAHPEFEVHSAVALDPHQRAAILRVIERERPAHVTYRLLGPSRIPGVSR
jgi:phage tail-like protein